MEYPMSRNRGKAFRSASAAPAPKVVSIPIHFVSSDSTRMKAAVRIQKVFRGFVVRKSMKKIVAIRKEADEMERKLSEKESLDLIRRDAKERLKMNEMLMSLLFRLDSVSGVYLGVRECRKSVIKKVIMLQERLDANETHKSDEQTEGKEMEVAEDRSCEDQEMEVAVEETEGNAAAESVSKSQAMPMEMQLNQGNTEVAGEVGSEEIQVDGGKVLMEKMIDKNEMLIKMVTDLCEKNKFQADMLKSLSKRVDNLEKKQQQQQQRSKSKKRRQASKICYHA